MSHKKTLQSWPSISKSKRLAIPAFLYHWKETGDKRGVFFIYDDNKSLRMVSNSYKWQFEGQVGCSLNNSDVSRIWILLLPFSGWQKIMHTALSPIFWGKTIFMWLSCSIIWWITFCYTIQVHTFTLVFISLIYRGFERMNSKMRNQWFHHWALPGHSIVTFLYWGKAKRIAVFSATITENFRGCSIFILSPITSNGR